MNILDVVGKDIVVTAHTITAKNAEGKTSGMVRGIDNLYEAQPRVQFALSGTLAKGGVKRFIYMMVLDKIIIYDGKLYFPVSEDELRLSEKTKNTVRHFEETGVITVLRCHSVKWSARKR